MDDDFEDMDSFDDDEDQSESAQDRLNVHKMPIMIKAQEIFKMTQIIVDTIPISEDELPVRELMLADAMMITVKITGAEAGDLYTLRMENAVIIKIHARSLMTFATSLGFDSDKHDDYIDLLRNEIEEFKILFKEWVAGFDIKHDIPDDWGLFNE
jgi:hypothetical protein